MRPPNYRDRTAEFKNIIKNIESKNINSGNQNGYGNQSALVPPNLFRDAALKISQGIYTTYVKLEKLGSLCKSKSLFEDNTDEISEFTYIIKTDVTYLKNEVEKLSSVMKNTEKTDSSHQKNHRRSILTSLEKDLANISRDFKGILEIRTENVKIQNERRDIFSKSVTIPTLVSSNDLKNSDTLKNRSSSLHSFGNNPMTAIDMENNQQVDIYSRNGREQSLNKANQQDELLIIQETCPTYLQDRLNAVQTIESTIVELGGIFQQLAVMVSEQEEHIQRIDHNIELTSLNVDAAHGELLKYFNNISSNRWLIFKIFGIFFIFIVIFILIA